MDWIEVKRKTKRGTLDERCVVGARKNCQTIQIFVKVKCSRTIPMDVSPSD